MKTKRLLASLAAVVAALSLSVTANAAGTTSDEEILPDEPTTAAEEVETLPAETEAPATEAPVAPAANPGTGNTPIALAVIPVAIAAAAVVAKKARK